MGKDSAILKSVAGRAVIKGIIGLDAGADRKTETGRKTYGRVQGSIEKYSRSWQAAFDYVAGTGGRSKLSAGTEIISARLCGLFLL